MLVSELMYKLKFFNPDAKVILGRNMRKKQLVILEYRPETSKYNPRLNGPGRVYIYNELEDRRGAE